jgi:hypothetical protein
MENGVPAVVSGFRDYRGPERTRGLGIGSIGVEVTGCFKPIAPSSRLFPKTEAGV